MNNLRLLLPILFVVFVINSCCTEDCGGGNGNYNFKATVYFINETSYYIKSIGCDRNIEPNKTFVFEIDGTLGSKATADNFPASVFSNCSMAYQEGANLKCENGIRNIENYENRKEVAPSEFEFTFRFTEGKKAVASLCE
jgi:hypothetical protein